MMPEDILEIDVPGRVYLDNIRRLITIERYLKNKPLERKQIQDDLKSAISPNLLRAIQEKDISQNYLHLIRNIIRERKTKIKKWEKKNYGKKRKCFSKNN